MAYIEFDGELDEPQTGGFVEFTGELDQEVASAPENDLSKPFIGMRSQRRQGDEPGARSAADPRRLDSPTGAKIAEDVAFLADRREKLKQANAGTKATPEQIESLAQFETANRGQSTPYGFEDRVSGYKAKGLSDVESTRNAVFDATLEQRLNEPFQKAAPSATGERISTSYQPEREAERVRKQGDDLASLRDDLIGRNAAGEMNASLRGMAKGGIQSTALTAGTIGYLGDVFGSDALKQWGLEKYDRGMKLANQLTLSKGASDIRSADDLTEWLAENAGYVAYQAAEAIITGGVGSVVGKQVGKEALVTAVGLGLNSMRQTLGSVYGEAVQEAKTTGKPMPSLLQVFSGAAASAAVDALADKIGLDAITAKGFKGNVLSRVGKSVGGQVAVQGGTEAVQLVPEEWGAGRDPFRDGMGKQYFDEAAVGALGGAGPGVMGAIARNPQDQIAAALTRELDTGQVPSDSVRAAAVEQERAKLESLRVSAIANIGAAQTVDEAIAAAQVAVNLPTSGPLERLNKRVNDADLLAKALGDAGIDAATSPAAPPIAAAVTEQAPAQVAPEPVVAPAAPATTQPEAPIAAPPTVLGRPVSEVQVGQLLQISKSAMFPDAVREVARQEVKRREIEAMYAQRDLAPQAKAAQEQTIIEAARDEKVDQAVALTSAQIVDAPTAMQLAFQRAQAKKAPVQSENPNVQNTAPAAAATQAVSPAAPAETATPARVDGAAPVGVSQPGAAAGVETAGVAVPTELGRNNQPISEGGKPFKTRAEVDAAKKLQPLMRVKKVKGGFILTQKTPAQIAAQAKAARRLGGTGVTGAMAAHELLASLGGLSKSTMADLGFDRNVRVGARWLFSGTGGLSLERATEALQQHGYMDGSDQAQGISIIQRSSKGDPQYTAEGWEQVAKAEAEARYEDHLAAQEEAAQNEDFDPFESLANDGYVIEDAEAAGLADATPEQLTEVLAGIDHLEAIGQDLDSIAERIALQYPDATQQEYHELVQDAINQAIDQAAQPASGRDDGQAGSGETAAPAVEAAPDAAEGSLLSSPTRADIEAQQERADAAARQEATDRQRAEQEDAAARERVEVARRSEAAADTFELGQDPMANLTGQQDIFGASQQETETGPQPKPAAPRASQPKTEVIEDLGEKIGGARKDTARATGSRAPKSDDSRPAWARRFQISQIVKAAGRDAKDEGRWVISDSRNTDWMKQPKQVGSSFATREEAEAAVPLAAVSLKHRAVPMRDGQWEIWRDITDRKRVKVVDQTFASRDEAMAYMAQNAVVILETSTTFGEADLPLSTDLERVGAARRTGDVAGQDFMDAFGFRGVEFGNWNNQAERQQVMNAAYDGLLDLAEVLNLPPKAISLNGDLALAFGARGHGLSGARAHYEPGKAVINLTKMNGAGALAHEWFHALDHYFGRQDGKASSTWETGADGTRSLKGAGVGDMATEGMRGDRSGVRAEIRAALRNVIEVMTRKAETYVDDTVKVDRFVGEARNEVRTSLERLRADLAQQLDPKYYSRKNAPATAEQLAEFDTIAEQLVQGVGLETSYRPVAGTKSLTGGRWTNEALEQLSAINKAVRGRTGFNAERSGTLDRLRSHLGRYEQRLKMLADAQSATEKKRAVPTEFAMDARSLDQGRGTDYWTTLPEMAARAFQGYVEDKVSGQGGKSPFLNHAPENAGILTPWGWKRPFPAGEERKAINAAIDKLVGEFKTRETDQGVMVYARDAGFNDAVDSAVNAAMKGDKPARQNVKIGTTPPALIAAGIPSGDLQTSPSVLAKVVFDHGVPKSVLKKVPDLLESPVMVFESDTVAGSYAVVTNEFVNGKPLLVIVSPEQTRGGVTFNFVPSLYPKDHLGAIQKWLDTGKLRYLDQKQSPSWLGSSRLQLPTEYRSTKGLQARNVATEADVVKTDGPVMSRPLSNDLFSRIMQPMPTSMAISDVRAAVDEVAATWKNAPPIRIVATPAELPQRNAPANARGAYDGKTVWVVAGNHRNAGQVFKTLAHEAIAHHGLRSILGDQWGKTMQVMQLALKSGNKALGELRDEVRAAYVDEQGKFNLTLQQEADEIAARAVERAIDPVTGEFRTGMAWLKSAYARVATWLREIGIPVTFTNFELQGMLSTAQEHLRTGSKPVFVTPGTLAEGALSRDENTPGGTQSANRGANDGQTSFYEQLRSVRSVGRRFADDELLQAYAGGDRTNAPRWGYIHHPGRNEGLATAYWTGGLAGEPGYYTSGIFFKLNGQRAFVMPVFPESALTSGDQSDVEKAFKEQKAAWHISAIERKPGLWEIGTDGAQPGDVYFEKMVELGELVPLRKGYHALVLPDGTKTRDLLREAARRLSAIYDGDTPSVFFSRDTGANPREKARILPPTAVEMRFARGAPAASRFKLDPEDWRGKTRRVMQDYFLRVRRVQEAIASQGGLVDETTDTYMAEELAYGRIQESLKDFANKMVKPMIEKAKTAGIDMDELALYAYAKHAKERNARIASIDPQMPDGGSGMTDAEADAILAKASPKRADFDSLHADLMAMTATTRQTLWQEGLITEDEFNALDGMYDNYVPLRGFELKDDEDKPTGLRAGKGFNIRGKETMRALGRQSRAGDVIENIIADYERAVVRAERNQVGKVFLNFVLQNPDPNLWEVDATRTKKALDRQTGLVARDTAIEKGEDTIAVKVAGREVYIQIHDDLLARAMRNAHKDETGEAERALIKTVGMYATLMRNTLTRFNPEFALVNTIRDFGFGTAAALDKLGEKGAAKFVKHYAGAYAASARAELGKGDPTNRAWDKWFEEYRAAGGTTGGFYTKGAEEIRSDIRTILLQAGAAPKDWKEKIQASGPMQLARAAGRVLEFAGAASENAARVAAYRTAREMGKSPSEAASIAKNLTTNFNRRGEAGQLLNSLFVFYNAAIQGAQRTAAMFKNPKMRGYLAAGTAGALGLALANATAGGDDEDDGQAYWDKIPDYVKERNLIIMLPPGTEVDGTEKVGTKGRYIAIPVQYGLNIFTVLGYNAADLIRHSIDETRGKDWLQAGVRTASTTFGSFNPFGGGMDNVHSAAMTVMPSVLDVVYQYAAGVNGFGRPTSPFKGDFDMSPDSENVNARQSGGISHRVARWVNSVTGGDEAEPGLVDMAPGTIEQTWRNLTGGTGVFIGDVLTIAAKQLDDQFGAGDNDYFVRDIPILRKVYGEADGDVDQSLFYERRREINEARTVEKRKAELGREMTDKRKVALASMATDGNKFARALSDIRKEMIEIGKDDEMSDTEKKVRLRELKVERDDLTREFNRIFMDTMRDMRDGAFDVEAEN